MSSFSYKKREEALFFLKAFKDKSWFKNAGIWNIFDKSLVNFILYQAGLRKGMTPETFDPKGVTTSEVLSVLNDLEVVLNYQENIANNIEESFLRRKIDFDSLADLLMIKAGIDILGKNKSLEEAFGIILNIVKPTGDFSKKMLTIIDKVGKNFNEEEVNKLKKALIITEGVPLVKFLRNTQL
ncbi:MAG: hypothetical protein NC821_06140, partial [Candidatus Omnitrophica bacterium]|nr:hypothetical protein [Candidatus Omnitrophota bacterium]